MILVGSSKGSDSAVLPAHQIGDLIVIFAFNEGSNTVPTIVVGYTSNATGTGGNNGAILASKVALSSSEVSGTWTGAESTIAHIYRSATGTLSVGSTPSVDENNFGTNISYLAVTMDDTSGSSWVAGFSGHSSNNGDFNTPPAGMVTREVSTPALNRAGSYDTNSGVVSWSTQSVNVGGSSSGWTSITAEIVETASSVVITDTTDPLNTNAEATVNGTGFEATQATGKVEQLQGAKITSLVIDTWSDLQIVADGLDVESTLYNYGTHDLKITADGGDSATVAFESIPAANNSYVNITSLATVGDRLTAIPDLAALDQVRYQSVLYSGASPTAYSVVVNTDATFSVSGSTPEGSYTFEVRAWDNDDSTWGVAANQGVTIGPGGGGGGTGAMIKPMINVMIQPMIKQMIN